MNRSSISSAEELGGYVQAVYRCWEFFFVGRRWEMTALLAVQWSYTFENGSSCFPRKSPPFYSDGLKVRHLPNLANHMTHPLATLINSSWDQDSNLGMNIPFLLSYSKTVLKQFFPFSPASSVLFSPLCWIFPIGKQTSTIKNVTCWSEFPLQLWAHSLLLFTEKLLESICLYLLSLIPVFQLPFEPTWTAESFHQSCLFKITCRHHVTKSRGWCCQHRPCSQGQQHSYSVIHPSQLLEALAPSGFRTPPFSGVTPTSLAIYLNCLTPCPTAIGVLRGLAVPWPSLLPWPSPPFVLFLLSPKCKLHEVRDFCQFWSLLHLQA